MRHQRVEVMASPAAAIRAAGKGNLHPPLEHEQEFLPGVAGQVGTVGEFPRRRDERTAACAWAGFRGERFQQCLRRPRVALELQAASRRTT